MGSEFVSELLERILCLNEGNSLTMRQEKDAEGNLTVVITVKVEPEQE